MQSLCHANSKTLVRHARYTGRKVSKTAPLEDPAASMRDSNSVTIARFLREYCNEPCAGARGPCYRASMGYNVLLAPELAVAYSISIMSHKPRSPLVSPQAGGDKRSLLPDATIDGPKRAAPEDEPSSPLLLLAG